MNTLIVEHILNGLQLGFSLFLISAGLTLVFGIMGVLNLAHGVLYMLGAYFITIIFRVVDSYILTFVFSIIALVIVGGIFERGLMRYLYNRSHLCQVLATFPIILFMNDLVSFIWGRAPLSFDVPPLLQGSIQILPNLPYPVYRLFIIGVGISLSLMLYYIITKTRMGMRIRAGATNREMLGALGVNVNVLYILLFTFSVVLAGLAGMISAPLISIETGIGGDVLITSFVVIIIGGMGSVKGAFISSLIVGIWETMVQAFAPSMLISYFGISASEAATVGIGFASISIYVLMVIILIFKPNGLYGTNHA